MPYSIALSGETGSGKTTQAGALAKHVFKTTRKKTILHTADRGRFGSIEHLVDLGVIVVDELQPEDSPWEWINRAADGSALAGLKSEDVGLRIYDSGTAIGEQVMTAISKDTNQIGQQKTQSFLIRKGKGGEKDIRVGLTNESHYGLAQTFLLDTIWKSTWLERKGQSVLWTFSIDRKDDSTGTPVVGPKLVGHALTPAIPKWFKYHFRLDQVPSDGINPARHILYLQAKAEVGGSGISLSNSRYPLEATEVLPPALEPADLVKALTLIEEGKASALAKAREELGL